MQQNPKQEVRRSKVRLRTLLLLGAGAVLSAFCLAEVLLRICLPGLSIHRFDQFQLLIDTGNDPFSRTLMPSKTLFWKFKPDQYIEEDPSGYYPGRISNSLGLRNEELNHEIAAHVFRILALGDSCTFGVGVPQDACYPQQLEDILSNRRGTRSRDAGGGTVQVLNAGVPGYSSFQGLNYFLEEGHALEPDLLLVCFGWNDAVVWDNRTDRFISRLLTKKPGSGLEGILHHSAVYRIFKKAQYSLMVKLGIGSRTPRVPVNEYIENLETLLTDARSRSVPAVFLLWPMKDQVAAKEPEPSPHQAAMRRFCEKNSVPLVDLLEAFRESGDASWFIDPGHVNAAGYRLVAESVAEILERHRLLP